MKWERARRSSNVEDRRGGRLPGGARIGGGLGIGGILLVLAIGWATGMSPLDMLGLVQQQSPPSAATATGEAPVRRVPSGDADSGIDDEQAFIAAILGSTEDVWAEVFGDRKPYEAPTLVMFAERVDSACGRGSAATGPFYCPADQKIYLDTGFFEEMRTRLGGGGDFAQAYVIAHEVAHHVQTLAGITRSLNAARLSGERMEGADGLLVKQELQADCFAGVWAHQAQKQLNWLEEGDIEEAIATAQAIGDDRLQRQAQGVVVPDSFTHGTSEQRIRWFQRGLDIGSLAGCDTYSQGEL